MPITVSKFTSTNEIDEATSAEVAAAGDAATTSLQGAMSAADKIIVNDLNGASFRYRGDWSSATAYVVNDMVRRGTNYLMYVCILARSATATTPESDPTYWLPLFDAAGRADQAVVGHPSDTAMASAIQASLPKSYTVADDDARYALTDLDCKPGDLITVTTTGKIWEVVDFLLLDSDDGYIYVADINSDSANILYTKVTTGGLTAFIAGCTGSGGFTIDSTHVYASHKSAITAINNQSGLFDGSVDLRGFTPGASCAWYLASNALTLVRLAAFTAGGFIDVSYNSMGAPALDQMFTDLGTLVGGKNMINVAGNPGAATCDTTIATLKGWTVSIV